MERKREKKGKQIADMLCAVEIELKDLPFTVKSGKENVNVAKLTVCGMEAEKQSDSIDTIVNSASPDLMGGEANTVDRTLHELIDQKLKENNVESTFNQMICSELAAGNDFVLSEDEACLSRIRCPRGKAVLTGGYWLCRYVIHAVGTKLVPVKEPEDTGEEDSCPGQANCRLHNKKPEKNCTSSSLQLLESCYYEIVRLIRQHPDIRNVAVPIIGSGNYGVNFKIAAKIAVSAIGNALMEWKQSDEEDFNTSKLENIIFFVKPKTEDEIMVNGGKVSKKGQIEIIKEIFAEYRKIYQQNHQVVFQDSFTSQRQYYNEILLNDEKRGYFSIARCFRCALVWCRMFFGLLSNKIKDTAGGNDWQKRRRAVERITLFKILFPVAGFLLARYCPHIGGTPAVHVVSFILFYSMADTATYLLGLLMMADIQKPSANVIRSLLLLFFNYIEVSLEIAYFYYVYCADITFEEALAFGVLGEGTNLAVVSAVPDMIIGYANAGLKFFFLTVVFGYLVQHMRQRKFRGER